MRRAALVLSLVVVVGLLAAAVSYASTIKVAAERPLVVRGSGFKPRELVRVTLVRMGDTRRVRRVRATAGGRLVVRFRLSLQDCPPWTISARGSRGSRALLRADPRIECAAP